MTPIAVLQKGVALSNSARWKYAGVALVAAVFLLHVVQSFGYLSSITDEHIITAAPLLLTLYFQIAADSDLGVPKKRASSSE